jgi:hypothetical protein
MWLTKKKKTLWPPTKSELLAGCLASLPIIQTGNVEPPDRLTPARHRRLEARRQLRFGYLAVAYDLVTWHLIGLTGIM